MGWIIGWIVDRLRWLLLLAAVGGPVIAFRAWDEAKRMREVQASGIETEAVIEGTTEKRRLASKFYSVRLSWKDEKGQPIEAKDLAITDDFAAKITANGVTESKLRIKYSPGSPDHDPIVVEDANKQIARVESAVPECIVVGIIGLLGSGLMFWRRRRRNAPEMAQA